MNVTSRTLGIAMASVGVVLWIVAVAVGAAPVAVILPILMVMGGGLLLARSGGSPTDGDVRTR